MGKKCRGESMSCFYCENGEKLRSLMIEVCPLEASTVYLNRDQKHKGRVIVALNQHKEELHQLTETERNQFFKETALVCQVIENLYQPQKINYAIYGDLVPHFHVHLVPKKEDGLFWGKPFQDLGVEKEFLSEEDYGQMIDEMKSEILKCQKTFQ